jgi:alkylation response protein AidB-like acyl-CoA dehydrogenase
MSFPYALTELQQQRLTLVDKLAKTFNERAKTHDLAGTFPHENYNDLHAQGFLRLVIPKEYGGEAVSLYELVVLTEHLARGDGGTGLAVSMLLHVLGRQREELSWPAEVYGEICRNITREGGLINSIVTEPQLGSISRGGIPVSTARPDGGVWRINGHKIFATGALALRYHVVAVSLPVAESAPKGEVGFAIVDARSPGIRIVPTWAGNLSFRSGGSDDIYYDDVAVPCNWLVERRAIGSPPPTSPGAGGWSLVIAAVYLGIGQAGVNAALDYANHRIPSVLDKPIASLPHIQHWLGEAQVQLDGARALLYSTAETWTKRPDTRPSLASAVAGSKYLCTNSACFATERALRVAGGFGLTRDLQLERFFRDARAGLFQPPQDDLALALIGRLALAAAG